MWLTAILLEKIKTQTGLIWSHRESNPVAAIKNNDTEIVNLLMDGLVNLGRSFRGISNKLRLFYNQVTPCGSFNNWGQSFKWVRQNKCNTNFTSHTTNNQKVPHCSLIDLKMDCITEEGWNDYCCLIWIRNKLRSVSYFTNTNRNKCCPWMGCDRWQHCFSPCQLVPVTEDDTQCQHCARRR